MTCDNCEQPAIYIYAPRQISPTHFCGKHLPSFLRQQAKDGLLETTPAYATAKSDALAKLQPAPVVEPEVVAEQDESEPLPAAEEPKPKRRRAPRKKAQPAQESDEE
jgi:hypothetical protein